MRKTISFKKEYLKENQKILIYGAGMYGQLTKCILNHIGIKVDYYIDRKLCGEKIEGVEIISPDAIKDYQNDVILIASTVYFGEMLEYLISQEMKCIYDIYELLLIDIEDNSLSEYVLDEKCNPYRYLFAISNSDDNPLVIRHCVIVVTEQCSLNCKDCATLMPYYKQPKAISAEENIRTLSNFLKTIERLNDLRILGGEPFLSSDLDVFLEWAIKCEKIDMITFYSNSTIVPKPNIMKLMQNSKVVLHLSDYGVVSRKLEKIKEECEKNNIKYYVHRYEKWYDYGNLDKRNRKEDELKKLFSSCGMSRCNTFYRGKFYICGRCPHGESVGAFINPNSDFIDFNEDNFDINEKRREIENIRTKLSYVLACDYCDGDDESKMIDAAVQVPRKKFI